MDITVSIAEMKARFSEYIAKTAYSKERYIITKRNKPIAALVNIEDLLMVKSAHEQEGLFAAIGKWENFEEIEPHLEEIYQGRQNEPGREISF